MIADCVRQGARELGYCSLHGPSANQVPLDLKVAEPRVYPLAEIPGLSNKIAVLYREIVKNFEAVETGVGSATFDAANLALDAVEFNVDKLFNVQQQVGNSLYAEKREALAQQIWRDYSADTLSFGADFFILAESLLNNYDKIINDEAREGSRALGIRLMRLSGRVYEQVGFAYANGMRHKHAAKAWKNAADAAALVIAHTSGDHRSSEYYRFQAAARLHRASYHWVIGRGRGSAEESLAESQKFMNDAGSISGLVEEERQIKASQPYWQK